MPVSLLSFLDISIHRHASLRRFDRHTSSIFDQSEFADSFLRRCIEEGYEVLKVLLLSSGLGHSAAELTSRGTGLGKWKARTRMDLGCAS